MILPLDFSTAGLYHADTVEFSEPDAECYESGAEIKTQHEADEDDAEYSEPDVEMEEDEDELGIIGGENKIFKHFKLSCRENIFT